MRGTWSTKQRMIMMRNRKLITSKYRDTFIFVSENNDDKCRRVMSKAAAKGNTNNNSHQTSQLIDENKKRF